MRVLLLNYEYPPLGGGAGNATRYLLKAFSQIDSLHIDLVTSSVDKFRVEQLYDRVTGHFLDINKKGSLHYQSTKDLLLYSWKSYWYSRKLVSLDKYDLIHAFFGIPCGFVAMKLGLPYIVSLRGSDVPGYNQRFALMDRLIFARLSRTVWKSAKRVIANSQGLRDLALKNSPDKSIEVIPNGVDAESFPVREKFMDQGKLKVLSVGRLIPRKGMIYLVQAIKDMDNVSLTIVGDGPLRNDLQKASIGMDVNFLGTLSHDELKNIYSKHDVFVLPSLNEGMSNTILEAMASGLPVIVTDTGGTKELINGNGFVMPMADSDALKAPILELVSQPSRLDAMGKKSREIALDMGWENISSKYLITYSCSSSFNRGEQT